MIEKILVYKWNMNGREQSVIRILRTMGISVTECEETFSDYHEDAAFAEKILNCIQSGGVQLVFSWNYVPLLASVCEMSRIPYAAWICDCPLQTLMSKTVLYKHNYLFCFDRSYAERLAALECENVYHFPLAVDVEPFEQTIVQEDMQMSEYTADVSLVGKPDKEKGIWMETEGFPEYVKGYLSGLVEAQLRVYGYNFVREMIREDVAKEMPDMAGSAAGQMYFSDPVQAAADLVNEEITRKERINVIEEVSKRHEIKLYPDSGDKLPFIYHNSKVNLHVTPRTIESGIPFQVLDILACGGFCLTNYQPEIAEFFEDGTEIVMYTSMEDMADKVDYYLHHEEERAAIAKAGNKKVREFFDLNEKLVRMLKFVEGE